MPRACILFANYYIVYMPTTTLSTRLDEAEAALIDELAENAGFDRSTFVKLLLRRGITAVRMGQAVDAYRAGQVSLARAAETAGISVWDFVSQMDSYGLELHYGAADLNADLAVLEEAKQ